MMSMILLLMTWWKTKYLHILEYCTNKSTTTNIYDADEETANTVITITIVATIAVDAVVVEQACGVEETGMEGGQLGIVKYLMGWANGLVGL